VELQPDVKLGIVQERNLAAMRDSELPTLRRACPGDRTPTATLSDGECETVCQLVPQLVRYFLVAVKNGGPTYSLTQVRL